MPWWGWVILVLVVVSLLSVLLLWVMLIGLADSMLQVERRLEEDRWR